VLDRLKAADRPPESLPLAHIGRGQGKRAAREADLLEGRQHRGTIQKRPDRRGIRTGERLDRSALKADLCRRARAVDRVQRTDRHAGARQVGKPEPRRAALILRGDEGVARFGCEEDRRLRSRKPILRHLRGDLARRKTAGFAKRGGDDRAAFGDPRQQRLLLRLRAHCLNGRDRQAQNRGERHRGQAAADLFGKDGQFDSAHARASVLFGNGESQPSAFGQSGPCCRVEPFGRLEPVMRDRKGRVIPQQPGQGFAYRILLVGKSEIHAGQPPQPHGHPCGRRPVRRG